MFIRTKGHIWTKGQSSNKNEVISKTFLFMGNMSPYYFKTIFTLCMEGIPSFIKIGGAVSEKNGDTRQTVVVLYIELCILKALFIFGTLQNTMILLLFC